jgi:DNA-binding NarL/FixJ family response regulator
VGRAIAQLNEPTPAPQPRSGRAEIAEALAISINTVKARLKESFERLGVDNRTELANVLRSGTLR